jgi:hypothetical protein
MAVNDGGVPPILAQKQCTQPSAFAPGNLLREARRQKRIAGSSIPDICILDPDRDISRPGRPTMIEGDLMAVEIEAAAAYAFAEARQKPVLCFAHVTNQMGRVDGDFEKGEADGSRDALELIAIAAGRLPSRLLP